MNNKERRYDMQHIHKLSLLIIPLFIFVNLSYAGTNEWTTNGPWGGRTGRVIVSPNNPNVLYTAHNGVLKSTNAGQTWFHSSNGMGLGMKCLLVGPSIAVNHPNVLHANG